MGNKRKPRSKRVGRLQRLQQRGHAKHKSDVITEVLKYRLHHKITQKEMANMLGVTSQQLCMWERGRIKVSPLMEFFIWRFLNTAES